MSIFRKIFGTANARLLKSFAPIIEEINNHENSLKTLSNENLRAKTNLFKEHLQNGRNIKEILPEAFAVCREGAKRTLKQRHYDVQLMGGITLHSGRIAEMKTGEGKTLVSTLAAYLNALTCKGVHIVTVNEYLAQRDAEWMGQIHQFLGLTVGCISSEMSLNDKIEAYNCDITYGTNSEFGFDYLRDQTKFNKKDITQKAHNFAIIDEVDSILIDEARTPLIISAPAIYDSKLYNQIDRIIPLLSKGDYELDEKHKNVHLTNQGIDNAEKLLIAHNILNKNEGLYDMKNIGLVHHLNQALKAHKLFKQNVDYLIKNDEVLLIDEFTGRVMDGRRYSEGLHQAIESKEKVTIQQENQSVASITYQNYFRIYKKLSGMTGTALTEANEFKATYNLDVIEIPTNRIIDRLDGEDSIYLTAEEKYSAIIDKITEVNKKKQPILVGTTSIKQSEHISKILKKAKIKHSILNAKHHEKEASIIAQAGELRAVTIATNMAGRGTDIMLGGNEDFQLKELTSKNTNKKNIDKTQAEINAKVALNREEVKKAGGLFVLGTERHESRRIDNQLRGRSGRQGDPGESKFYLSLEDDLMRIFGSEKISGLLSKLGLKEGEVLSHPWINKALEKAQTKVEAMNFDVRKNLLKFDDVMNEQRKLIFSERSQILSKNSIDTEILDIINELNENKIREYIPEKSYIEKWDLEGLDHYLYSIYNYKFNITEYAKAENVTEIEITTNINKKCKELYRSLFFGYEEKVSIKAKKYIYLSCLDEVWREHLSTMDQLKQGIGLRAYGQKDPLNEYKKESFNLFLNMLSKLHETVIDTIFHTALNIEEHKINNLLQQEQNSIEQNEILNQEFTQHKKSNIFLKRVNAEDRNSNDITSWGKVSRNEMCPCGSQKKYKFCHGKL